LTNSSTLKVGQVVSAIGNTMGFSNLLSTGIISGLGKFIPTFGQNISGSDVKIPNGITTNLNLGYGYGGSPLFDNEGRVVGMNIGNYSSPAAGQSKNNGISFAIPSNLISKIVPSLLEKGYYAHPWFGAGGTDVDLDIAKALNLTESRGFLVIDVTPSSPAKKAGILGGDNVTDIKGRKITLGGDIILKVDNKNVQNIQELSGYIENNKNIGDDMLVTLLRNGIIQLINVRLDANPNYLLPLK
jgi:S1-C subfamily serine protease